MLFRGILVSLLLPVWAALGLVAVGLASQAEVPLTEDQLDVIGLGASNLGAFQTAAVVVLVGGLAIHTLVAVVTSRAVAAMAGSVGGVIGVVIAGAAAAGLAMAPSGERVDVLSLLVRPIAIATIAIISLALGFRAYLAHTGKWRYRKWESADDWGDGGWGDDGGD